MNNIDKAYIAGFFDGEGSICIVKVNLKNRINPRYALAVEIANIDIDILKYIQKLFGGRIIEKKDNNKLGKRLCFRWNIACSVAEKFLETILPFLKIKNKQATLALKYRHWLNTIPKTTHKPQSIVFIKRKEFFRNKMRNLNHGGKGAKL